MARLCEICGVQPAEVRATVFTGDGRREALDPCRQDYRRPAGRQGFSSPLGSLFGGRGSLLDQFFGGACAEDPSGGRDATAGRRIPLEGGTRRRGAAAGGLAERLSRHAEKLLRDAARTAQEWGRREVDTEHLAHAPLDSEAARMTLERFEVSAGEFRDQIEREARRGEDKGAEPADTGEIGVSPRVKDALSRAFAASRDLGHSYVGPEHLLIGLAEEGRGRRPVVLEPRRPTPPEAATEGTAPASAPARPEAGPATQNRDRRNSRRAAAE